MDAGRELDMLIAKKVMGEEHETRDTIPRYSTDIAAAWTVVEVFRCGTFPNGCACCVDLSITDAITTDGDCTCTIYGPVTKRVIGQARTMPLAICRAAMKLDDENT